MDTSGNRLFSLQTCPAPARSAVTSAGGLIVAMGSSTSVECIRQITLFLQNKAKFTKYPNELNINYNKGLYQFSVFRPAQKQSQNKPKTKPNKANFQNDQNECKLNYNNGLWQKSGVLPKKNKAKAKPNKANLPPAQGRGNGG